MGELKQHQIRLRDPATPRHRRAAIRLGRIFRWWLRTLIGLLIVTVHTVALAILLIWFLLR